MRVFQAVTEDRVEVLAKGRKYLWRRSRTICRGIFAKLTTASVESDAIARLTRALYGKRSIAVINGGEAGD